MRVGSLFSGIGGFDLGFERAGMTVAFQCEIDKDARKVLGERWPDVPCYEDVKEIHGRRACRDDVRLAGVGGERHVVAGQGSELDRSSPGVRGDVAVEQDAGRVHRPAATDDGGFGTDGCPACLPAVDVLCGGFPCQDLSVAGRRAGLAGERSGLFHEFMRVAGELAPRWVVVENVPGLLSSNGGRDMGVVVGTLADLGYGWAYRVLDAQFFGVAQRRRRVFIVGCLGDTAAAAQVLFEPESCGGDSPPSRTARAGAAGGSAGRATGGVADTLRSHPRPGSNSNGALVAATLNSGGNNGGFRTEPGEHLVPIGFHQTQDPISEDNLTPALGATSIGMGIAYRKAARVSGPDTPETWVDDGLANTLNGFDVGDVRTTHAVVQPLSVAAFSENQRGEVLETDYSRQLTTGGGKPGQGYPAVRDGMAVRRVTPVECERLQGFPDEWTGSLSDSARYRTLGNAVAVPVAEWIARRMT